MDVAKSSCFAASVITDQTFKDLPVTEVRCPYELEYIWGWFHELDETRENGLSLGPITHTEITKWAEGFNIRLQPIERKAIRALDRAFFKYQTKKAKEEK